MILSVLVCSVSVLIKLSYRVLCSKIYIKTFDALFTDCGDILNVRPNPYLNSFVSVSSVGVNPSYLVGSIPKPCLTLAFLGL